MGDNSDKPDALLNKLDILMRSSRAENSGNPPPVLTEALTDDKQTLIPTLTDAVRIHPPASSDVQGDNAQKMGDVIAARLVACVNREMASLLKEFSAHRDKLAVLHRSIKFALPQLVRLRWEEKAVDDPDTSSDAGTKPDQPG